MKSLTAMFNTRRDLILALGLVLVTLIAYAPALRDGFVFDDYWLIAENPTVNASDGLYRFWCTTDAPYYYPLTGTLWWLEWQQWGKSPFGYHLVNVLLHAINVILVWQILRRLKIPGAWMAALVFAIHPVNVATVAWISEQKNTLSMLFFLIAILFYLKFDEALRWGWYGFSLMAFLLALFSKTAVVMLPVVLLGCVWWLRGRVRWQDLLHFAPFFILSLILGLVTIWFENRTLGEYAARTDGLYRLVEASWVPWFYLYKALLPFNLTMIYPKWDVDASYWASYLPGLAIVGGFALFWWKHRSWGRPLLFGLGYFIVTLFPVLGFFYESFHSFSLVADHLQYYSIIGVIALVVAAGNKLCLRWGKRGRNIGILASLVALASLGAATWTRANVYRNDETLWRDNVTKNPSAWIAQNNLGTVLRTKGNMSEAIVHFEQALRINPDSAGAHFNLAVTLERTGEVEAAIKHYEQALQIDPSLGDVARARIARLRAMPNR
jgi:protein O-mannosyl-transferase